MGPAALQTLGPLARRACRVGSVRGKRRAASSPAVQLHAPAKPMTERKNDPLSSRAASMGRGLAGYGVAHPYPPMAAASAMTFVNNLGAPLPTPSNLAALSALGCSGSQRARGAENCISVMSTTFTLRVMYSCGSDAEIKPTLSAFQNRPRRLLLAHGQRRPLFGNALLLRWAVLANDGVVLVARARCLQAESSRSIRMDVLLVQVRVHPCWPGQQGVQVRRRSRKRRKRRRRRRSPRYAGLSCSRAFRSSGQSLPNLLLRQ